MTMVISPITDYHIKRPYCVNCYNPLRYRTFSYDTYGYKQRIKMFQYHHGIGLRKVLKDCDHNLLVCDKCNLLYLIDGVWDQFTRIFRITCDGNDYITNN